MNVFDSLTNYDGVIKTIEMHTCGEPTRIIIAGYPAFKSKRLLDKRREAAERFDYIRKRLMHEPRGHGEMYGAILVKETELTKSGEADIGVLFCHNEGYSTMCGHATIALGRLLVDAQNSGLFSEKVKLRYEAESGTTKLRLHAPCGVVNVSVPTIDGKSNPLGDVTFLSVPSFVAAMDLEVVIPEDKQWKGLTSMGGIIRLDVAFGGAFYAIVTAQALGFSLGLPGPYLLEEFNEATRALEGWLQQNSSLVFKHHGGETDLEYLYGVIVTDGESGLCFFADQQVDRSPTGSGVSARVALELTRGTMGLGERRQYRSIVGSEGVFTGKAVSVQSDGSVIVAVSGRGHYIGASSFIAESGDALADGFVFGLGRRITGKGINDGLNDVSGVSE